MNPVLWVEWENRLEAALENPAWRSLLEAKVLRFLLSRYASSSEETPVPARSYYRGRSPIGEAKVPPSPITTKRTLRRIARANFEARDEPVLSPAMQQFLEEGPYRDIQRRQRGNYKSTLNRMVGEYFPSARWLEADVSAALIKFARRFLN
jgi:hypothetical protein